MNEAERQRIRVKRRYYRTLDGINEARALVIKLTEQHHAAIERQQKHVLLQEQVTEELDQAQEGQRALKLYVEASSLADRLRTEKERLIALIQDREKLQHRVATLFDEFDGGKHVRRLLLQMKGWLVLRCVAARSLGDHELGRFG